MSGQEAQHPACSDQHHLPPVGTPWPRCPRPRSRPKRGCLSLSCPLILLMMPGASPGSTQCSLQQTSLPPSLALSTPWEATFSLYTQGNRLPGDASPSPCLAETGLPIPLAHPAPEPECLPLPELPGVRRQQSVLAGAKKQPGWRSARTGQSTSKGLGQDFNWGTLGQVERVTGLKRLQMQARS